MEAERKLRLCCLPACEGLKFDLVHKFPRGDARANEWLKAINLPELNAMPIEEVRRRRYVCRRHFSPEDYKHAQSRSLNSTALPRLFLEKTSTSPVEVWTEPTRNLTCCIPDCDEVDPKLVSEFPYSETISQEWIKAANLTELSRLRLIDIHRRRLGVCYQHFQKKDFNETGGISPTAIPSIFNHRVTVVPRKRRSMGQTSTNLRKIIIIDSRNQQQMLARQRQAQQQQQQLDPELADDEIEIVEAVEEEHQLLDEENHVIFESRNNFETDHSYVAPAEQTDTKVEIMLENMLKLTHKKLQPGFKVNLYWLRVHCRCEFCYEEATFQKKVYFTDIPLGIKPVQYNLEDDGLHVTWEDNHKSVYTFEFLINYNYENRQKYYQQQASRVVLWNKKSIQDADYARISLNDLLCDDSAVHRVLDSLVRYGFAFIEKVPPTEHSTEMAITRMFPVMDTFFGHMWTFSNQFVHSDLAYTTNFLPCHNDNTYFSEAAGLQVLHCIKYEGQGGENMMVDGWKAAELLRAKHPDSFDRLVNKWKIPSEYLEEGRKHMAVGPVIKLDPITGSIEQLRFNMNDLAVFDTVPMEEMQLFYTDMHRLAAEVQDQKNELTFQLQPGTIWIFDNWRVMHGRNEYTGKRVMTGCYVARTEFTSAARVAGAL